MLNMNMRGASLIEMMIVVAIIGILASLSTPMVSTYLQNAKLRSTADELKEALELSRSEAIKRNDTIKFTALSAGGWVVEAYSNDTLTTLQSKANAAGAQTVVSTDNNVIRFDGSGRPDLAAIIKLAPVSGACTTVTCLNIELNRYGKIKVCNPDTTNEVLKCDS
jgi:type IV fimbrial biogenesis protein FimT